MKTSKFLLFSMVFLLIASTAVIYRQLRFVEKIDIGFDKEVLFYLPINKNIKDQKKAFQEELIKHPAIENVSYSYGSYRTSNERWGLEYNDENITLHIEAVDKNYISTLGLDIISGRDFRCAGDLRNVIINERASEKYFGPDPIGIRIESMGEKAEIVGVVKNFSFNSLHSEIEPIALIYRDDWASLCNIRVAGDNFSEALKHTERIWKDFCPDFPFDYHFVDNYYRNKYSKERGLGRLLILFSIASVIIACLGIFGLITFSVIKRAKEIGIRKVNGASTAMILKMLTMELSTIFLWSLIPAFIIIIIIMNRWLSGFAYHTNIPVWIYPVSTFIVWLVAILSTIGMTLQTANIQPSEVLRSN